MKRLRIIWVILFCIAAGASMSIRAQANISVDRMVVDQRDTLPDQESKVDARMEVQTTSGNIIQGSAQPGEQAGPIPGKFGYVRTAEQSNTDPVERIWNEIDHPGSSLNNQEMPRSRRPWSFSTSLGTAYHFFPGFGAAMNMYATPRVDYAVNQRMSFQAGMMAGRTLPVTSLNNEESFLNTGMTNISTYISGAYMLTENLVIHGSGAKRVLMMPVNGTLQSVNYNDLSIGATYNFGNFSIGATIHRSDAPIYNSPFGGGTTFPGSPFYW